MIFDNFMKSQKFKKNKMMNNNVINMKDDIKKYTIIKDSQNNLIKDNMYNFNFNQKPGNTFNKLGNLIISQSTLALNKKNTYNFDRNNIKLNNNNNNYYYLKNEGNNENLFQAKLKEKKDNEKYDLFNKEEYNNLYQKGKGLTNQIRKHINNYNNNINELNIKEFEEKINNELSTIHNINNENFNFGKTLDIDQETLENNKKDEKLIRKYS